MHDKGILHLQQIPALSLPGEHIIAASFRESIISDGDNPMIVIDDGGTHLCVRVLGPQCGQMGKSHEIFIPR